MEIHPNVRLLPISPKQEGLVIACQKLEKQLLDLYREAAFIGCDLHVTTESNGKITGLSLWRPKS